MTVGTEEGDTASASEDGMDYLASLFQNADYKQIMQVIFGPTVQKIKNSDFFKVMMCIITNSRSFYAFYRSMGRLLRTCHLSSFATFVGSLEDSRGRKVKEYLQRCQIKEQPPPQRTQELEFTICKATVQCLIVCLFACKLQIRHKL